MWSVSRTQNLIKLRDAASKKSDMPKTVVQRRAGRNIINASSNKSEKNKNSSQSWSSLIAVSSVWCFLSLFALFLHNSRLYLFPLTHAWSTLQAKKGERINSSHFCFYFSRFGFKLFLKISSNYFTPERDAKATGHGKIRLLFLQFFCTALKAICLTNLLL